MYLRVCAALLQAIGQSIGASIRPRDRDGETGGSGRANMGRMDWNGYRIVTLIYHGKISHHTSPGLADFLHVKEGRHNEEKVLIKEGRHNEKKVLPRHLSRRADTTRKRYQVLIKEGRHSKKRYYQATYQGGQTPREKKWDKKEGKVSTRSSFHTQTHRSGV